MFGKCFLSGSLMPIDVSSQWRRLGKWRFAVCVYSDTGPCCADREAATVDVNIYLQKRPTFFEVQFSSVLGSRING